MKYIFRECPIMTPGNTHFVRFFAANIAYFVRFSNWIRPKLSVFPKKTIQWPHIVNAAYQNSQAPPVPQAPLQLPFPPRSLKKFMKNSWSIRVNSCCSATLHPSRTRSVKKIAILYFRTRISRIPRILHLRLNHIRLIRAIRVSQKTLSIITILNTELTESTEPM